MKSLTAMITCLTVLSLGGIASRLEASIITVPTGLAPGSQYRLVFVTNGTYQATSTSISTYNNDVTTEANQIPLLAALGASWYAIASTFGNSAATNIGASPSTVGIYLLDGVTLVADGTGTTASGLFSTGLANSGGQLFSPVLFSDLGQKVGNENVWTGSQSNGQPSLFTALGDNGGTLGFAVLINSFWIDGGESAVSTTFEPLYAISSVLTVPGAPTSTPEPTTTALEALGLASLFAALRLHKQPNLLANRADR